MRVDLAFGKNGLSLELPGQFDYRILEARGARSLTDPERALDDALARPIGSPSLGELARGRRSAAISVCDITRPAPNRQTLPPILRTLAEAGITAPNITILVATGLHRAATAEEIDLIVGPRSPGNASCSTTTRGTWTSTAILARRATTRLPMSTGDSSTPTSTSRWASSSRT
jgi:nickel-dependent lactate racemase